MIKSYADFVIEDRNGITLTLTSDCENEKNSSEDSTMVEDFSVYFEPKMSPK